MRCWIAYHDDLYHTCVLEDSHEPEEFELEPGLAFETPRGLVAYFRVYEPEVTSFGICSPEMMWLE